MVYSLNRKYPRLDCVSRGHVTPRTSLLDAMTPLLLQLSFAVLIVGAFVGKLT